MEKLEPQRIIYVDGGLNKVVKPKSFISSCHQSDLSSKYSYDTASSFVHIANYNTFCMQLAFGIDDH
jgi:hypothetical protein